MKQLLTTSLCTLGLFLGMSATAWAQATACDAPAEQPGGYPTDGTWGGTGGDALTINCTVPAVAVVDDVALTLDITHTFASDIEVTLTAPDGTTGGLLAGDYCGLNDNMRITLASFGTAHVNSCDGGGAPDAWIDGNAYTTGGDPGNSEVDMGTGFDGIAGLSYDGREGFGIFKGVQARGTWTLILNDDANGDFGTVETAPMLNVSGTPLPVELAAFEVTLDGDVARLTWETASETDNAGFEVQTRLDGEADFGTVGYVEGNGTTNDPHAYSFQVADLAYGTHSFRLKQIDFDGEFNFTPIVEATRELANGYALDRFYPNPFNPQGTFRVMVANDQAVSINVYNIMGQLVTTLHEGILEGQEWHQFTFRAGNNLPSGTYLIRATGDSFANTQKVMLVK